jgi:hypothetical protein
VARDGCTMRADDGGTSEAAPSPRETPLERSFYGHVELADQDGY